MYKLEESLFHVRVDPYVTKTVTALGRNDAMIRSSWKEFPEMYAKTLLAVALITTSLVKLQLFKVVL